MQICTHDYLPAIHIKNKKIIDNFTFIPFVRDWCKFRIHFQLVQICMETGRCNNQMNRRPHKNCKHEIQIESDFCSLKLEYSFSNKM